MTPTEQDKELRRLISDVMADLMVDVSLKKLSKNDGDIIEKGRLYLESHNDRLDIIMQLITAERKRAALEERIDEVERELKRYGDVFNYPPQLLMRKVELKRLKEEK